VLGLKVLRGIQWVRRKYKRPAMQTFYLVSFAYYASFVVQTSFLTIFTWNTFSDEIT